MPKNNETFYSSANVDLFYSESEKKLFWIAGYTDNTCGVDAHINMLTAKRDMFLDMCGLPKDTKIFSDYITKSRRYKSMRYFWANDVSEAPEEAFKLGSDWTMYKWIED